MKAYSYTGGGRTAMGTKARVGEIAVDPRVIPLGSRVYIEASVPGLRRIPAATSRAIPSIFI